MLLAHCHNQTAAVIDRLGKVGKPSQYAIFHFGTFYRMGLKALYGQYASVFMVCYAMRLSTPLFISFIKIVECRGVTFCTKNTLYRYGIVCLRKSH